MPPNPNVSFLSIQINDFNLGKCGRFQAFGLLQLPHRSSIGKCFTETNLFPFKFQRHKIIKLNKVLGWAFIQVSITIKSKSREKLLFLFILLKLCIVIKTTYCTRILQYAIWQLFIHMLLYSWILTCKFKFCQPNQWLIVLYAWSKDDHVL